MTYPHLSLSRQLIFERPDDSAVATPRQMADPALTRRVLDLLVVERCNVLVTGQATDRLDRWGKNIAVALRSRADVELELYLPSTADALVARFNAAMASLSLERARASERRDSVLRVLLVPDSRSLMTPEGQLLARLVGDFPAAEIRLLILADVGSEAANRSLRDILARRLRQVDLESAASGQSAELTPVAPLPVAGGLALARVTGAARIRVPADQSMGRLPAVPWKLTKPPPGAQRPALSAWQRLVAWGSVFVSLALVSVLVVVLLYRDRTPGGFAPINASKAAITAKPPAGRADPLPIGRLP